MFEDRRVGEKMCLFLWFPVYDTQSVPQPSIVRGTLISKKFMHIMKLLVHLLHLTVKLANPLLCAQPTQKKHTDIPEYFL